MKRLVVVEVEVETDRHCHKKCPWHRVSLSWVASCTLFEKPLSEREASYFLRLPECVAAEATP